MQGGKILKLRYLLSRYLLLPVFKTLAGRYYYKTIRYKRFLERSQYWDRSEMKTFRDRQFKNLISHCYRNVPFYREYMVRQKLTPDDFQTIKDISKFPLMSKQILNENQKALTATNYKMKWIQNECSGGTTGILSHFGIDKKNYYKVDGNYLRFWECAGYRQGMKMALLWGNELELARGKSVHERLKMFVENTKMLNFYDLSEEKLKKYTECLLRWKPDIIRGYSTAIYLYVKYCNSNAIRFKNKPKSIIITSDKISDQQKVEIEDFFECKVFEEYGSREFYVMAQECNAHQGLHLAEELFVFEILDLISGECRFQGRGEIIVTSLVNYAMPLLRFRLGDEVTIQPGKCHCGRKLMKISNIEGRIGDFVITKNGKFIYQNFFANVFAIHRGIDRFQLQQYEKGKVQIKVIKNKNFKQEEMDQVMLRFKSMLKNDLEMTLTYVNKIEIPTSGKRRPIISHIASQYLPK